MLYTMSSENNETRTRILQAAWHLLEASQGKGVRMSDIAKQAELSRQAVYLHFSTRSELLIATTRYIDDVKDVKDVELRLAASRTARSGVDRLNAFIRAWGEYIPEIYGVAKALLAMKDTDEAAESAWNDRMRALRQGCEAAINALESDGALSSEYSAQEAVDILWTMLSVRNWEQLTRECGWSEKKYIEKTQLLSQRILVNDAKAS
jgi:AcrR family transcriptional regulator